MRLARVDTDPYIDKKSNRLMPGQRPQTTPNPPSYLPNLLHLPLALDPPPLNLPLVPQTRIHGVRLNDQQRKIPDQSNGVEEIRVTATGIQPEVMKSRAEKATVQQSC